MAYRDPEEGRTRDRERFRKRTAERIAQGLCPNCGKAPPAPDHVLCRRCTGKRRAAERARYAKAKAAGKLYGGRDPEERRRYARGRTRRRYDARREAGLCTRCGLHPPIESHTACEPCREADGRTRQWAAVGGRCGEATFDGAALEAVRQRQKNAASRKRYA